MPSSATPPDTGAGLQSAWRHELLTRLGWALLVMGAFIVPYSASRGWDVPRLAALAVLPVCGVVSSVFGSRIDLRLRAWLLVASLLVFEGTLATMAGPAPGTVVSLLLAAVVAALVFGRRGSLLTLGAGAAIFLVLGSASRVEVAAIWAAELPRMSAWVRVTILWLLPGSLIPLLVATAVRLAEANAARLRDSEERYRLLFESNPMPMLVYELETQLIVAVNEASVRQYGYSREELLHMTVSDLGIPGDSGSARLLDELRRPRPPVLHVGLRQQRRRDGSVIDVDLTSLEVTFEGRAARLTTARDVTPERDALAESARLQRAVEQAATEWQRTFDAVEQALVVFDTDCRVVRLNRRAAAMVAARSEDALPGRHVGELGRHEPWPTAARLLATAAEAASACSAEARDQPGGRAWTLTASRAPVGAAGEPRLILVIAEISRLIELQESLRRSETMAAMGGLVAGVAHEVRNALFGISATIDALEARSGHEPRYAPFATVLRSQLGRLQQLTHDLLDYGKPPELRLAEARTEQIVGLAVKTCATVARDHAVSVVQELAVDLPALSVDAGRIQQVVENLVANAIQHSPKGGIVRVTAQPDRDSGARAISLVVEDQGPGVSADDAARLFEPFFSRRRGGTGLGLSIVRRIVEAHGGQVELESAERGARFRVRLPTSASLRH